MMKIITYFSILLMFSCNANGAKIDKEAFTDQVLYECVLEYEKLIGSIYSEATGKVSNKFEVLSCTGDIESYEGIEQLTDLKDLIIINSDAPDLAPLSSLTKLKSLLILAGDVKDISPLSHLTELTYLNLERNDIHDISPLASLTKLEELELTNNQIVDISPLSGLNNLRKLILVDNEIVDVAPLSSLSNLKELNLNRIEKRLANPIVNAKPLLVLKGLEKLSINSDTIVCEHRKQLQEMFTYEQLGGINANGCPVKVPCKSMEDMQEYYGDNVKYDFEACTITSPTEAESIELEG